MAYRLYQEIGQNKTPTLDAQDADNLFIRLRT